MPWTAEFLEQLAKQNIHPRLTFECIPDFDRFISGNPLVGAFRFTGDWKFSTHKIPGYIPAIMKEESMLGGAVGRLSTGQWTISRGTWSIALSLSPAEVATLRGQITRGQGCMIKMGFGSDPATYEPFLLGVVKQLTRRRASRWIVQCEDITAYLGCRARPTAELDGSFADQSALFFQMLPEPTALAGPGGYTPGDAVVKVADSTGSQRSSEGLYLLEITPNPPGGGGEAVPFYITAELRDSSLTPHEFTGCSPTAVYGTTAAVAATGNAVRIVAHDVGHPIDIVRRLLVSSGERVFLGVPGVPPDPGSNGEFDMLHESWGFNIDQAWIDHDDCDWHKSHGDESIGLAGWVMLVTQPQANPLSWLSSWLAPGGYWLTQRQGKLTVRCVVDVEAYDNTPTFTITDADIKQITSYQGWDSSSPVEYDHARYFAGSGEELLFDDDLAPAETLPAESVYEVLLDAVRQDGATWLGHISERTGGWLTRIPEIVEMECVGLRTAQLTPGDLVLFTTAQLGGRDATPEAPTFDQRVCLVLGLSPDPFTATVTVILAIRPLSVIS